MNVTIIIVHSIICYSSVLVLTGATLERSGVVKIYLQRELMSDRPTTFQGEKLVQWTLFEGQAKRSRDIFLTNKISRFLFSFISWKC
jgi:hypothetical protein